VPVRLQKADLDKPVVRELLQATFEIPDPGAVPWSERQAQPTVDAAGTVAQEAPSGADAQ
jgi:hypothetical protein